MQSPATISKKPHKRVDIGKRTLLVLLGSVLLIVAASLVVKGLQVLQFERPGTPVHQGSAIIGFILLCVPVLFSYTKRSGLASSPPKWFVSHVLCSTCGLVFIIFHTLGGDLLSVPGFVLFLLLFVSIQGFISRALLAAPLSNLFAGKVINFKQAEPGRRDKLRKIIEQKIDVLKRLDPSANEALFSVNLKHWVKHPILSWRYAKLARDEAGLVGARRLAGAKLSLWRKIHISCALLFILGMGAHVIVVTFFAGYVANGSEIYWWHVSDWGTQWRQ